MRRFLQHNRWVTVLVACLLLFATSGFSLSRMTCLMGGHTVLSFGQADDCCPDSEGSDGPVLTADCCALTQAKLDGVSMITSNTLDIDPGILVSGTWVLCAFEAPAAVPLGWLYSRPPPMSTPERLASFGTFLI